MMSMATLSCKLWQLNNNLDYYRKAVCTSGCLLTGGPPLYVNINVYYEQMKTQQSKHSVYFLSSFILIDTQ